MIQHILGPSLCQSKIHCWLICESHAFASSTDRPPSASFPFLSVFAPSFQPLRTKRASSEAAILISTTECGCQTVVTMSCHQLPVESSTNAHFFYFSKTDINHQNEVSFPSGEWTPCDGYFSRRPVIWFEPVLLKQSEAVFNATHFSLLSLI